MYMDRFSRNHIAMSVVKYNDDSEVKAESTSPRSYVLASRFTQLVNNT